MASKSSSSEASQQRNCVAIGDVEGIIHESIIAGRDVNFIIRIVQQTGGQFPLPCNLPAQLAALQQALPHLTHPAEKAITQATIERPERAKTVARKTVEVGRAVNLIAEKLELLVEKFGVAALWTAATIATRPVTVACVEKFGVAALWAAKLVATRVRLECEWSGENVGDFSGRYCWGSTRLRSQDNALRITPQDYVLRITFSGLRSQDYVLRITFSGLRSQDYILRITFSDYALSTLSEGESMMILSYNPLGDNLAWVWELLALLITFGVIQALVLVNGVLQKRELLPTYITRKIIHIFAALFYLLCWMLYSGSTTSRYLAMVVPLTFIVWFAAIGLGLRKDETIVNSMSRSGDPRELLGGTMHYAIVMLFATLLFFETAVPGTAVNPAALLIIGALAGGDGLAEIIGRRYGGERKFGIGGSEKTVAGTIAMFVGSAVMILALLTAFSISTALVLSSTIGLVVLSSLLATIAEALSPKGIDNYVISIAVFIGIIIIYLVTPEMWPYPTLFTL